MDKFIIDRFEGAYAICENYYTKEFINIPISQIPTDAKEGTIIKLVDGIYEIDFDDTKSISARIKAKMNKLWK